MASRLVRACAEFSNHRQRPFFHNGTYVEMGAADGKSVSNTIFFERHLGWSGVLIEPSAAFERLRITRGRNPRNTLLNEACCAEAVRGLC
jgi:hypothetical protein